MQRQSIPFENYFSIRDVYKVTVSPYSRKRIKEWATSHVRQETQRWCAFYLQALQIHDRLQQAYSFIDKLEYGAAAPLLESMGWDAERILQFDVPGSGRRINKPTKHKDPLVCLHGLIGCFVGLFDRICCGVGFVCLDIAVVS